ncbi:DUF456 domain-containing protein [Nocardia australiensis]|uniref:DUF456 domain-containing protein n=1 Tax=Nocardia australiensis TaxID=2887191 RepID=UPI001D14362D|nr:DUF456 domain-containing protein [Nocardia australiensis]
MKYKKFAATALMAVAATGIATGTTNAAPAAPAPIPAVQGEATSPTVKGEDQGVNYAVQLVDGNKSIVTTLTGGAFSLDADQKAVSVKNEAGNVVGSVPLAAKVADGPLIPIAAAIDATGQRLTLTPDIKPVASGLSATEIGASQDRFFAELQRASLGALIGGIIGFFFLGVGLPIGALVGLLIAGGPNLIDAGVAYFSGQP